MLYLGESLILVFFLLMLVFPSVLQLERGILLALICFGAIAILFRSPERWRVAKPVLACLLICISFSIFGIAIGLINSTPGAISVGTVYVLWPLIFVFFMGFSSRIETYIRLQKTLIIGIAIATVSGLLLVLSNYFGFISVFINPYFDLLDSGVGLYDNRIEAKLLSMGLVIYGIPFLVTLIVNIARENSWGASTRWMLFSIVILSLSVIYMVVSGRRAFLIIGLLSIPLSILVLKLSNTGHSFSYKSILKFSLLSIILFLLGMLAGKFIFDLDYEKIWIDLIEGFNFDDSSNISAYRRTVQFEALIAGWLDSPIIGAGHGAAAWDKIGEQRQAWAYELQYIALLFQVGILGLTIYSLAVIWLMYQMIRLSKIYSDLATLITPSLTGLICFLIANATNPYLSKFDFLWVIFIPVGLVNIGLLREQKQQSHRTTINGVSPCV